MKISWQKAVGQGEMLQVEVNVNDDVVKREGATGLLERLRPGFQIGDGRLYELNVWMLDHMQAIRKATPEQQMAIKQSVAILHGQSMPDIPQESLDADREARETAIKAESAERLEAALEAADAAFPKEEKVIVPAEASVQARADALERVLSS